jgi:hypothetical protein
VSGHTHFVVTGFPPEKISVGGGAKKNLKPKKKKSFVFFCFFLSGNNSPDQSINQSINQVTYIALQIFPLAF